jgi:hypothetical protein
MDTGEAVESLNNMARNGALPTGTGDSYQARFSNAGLTHPLSMAILVATT